MTFVGILGILLALLAFPVSSVQKTPKNVFIFAAILMIHVAATFYYHYWAQTNATDSTVYYEDQLDFYGRGFGLNTAFVIYVVQFLRELIGGTYLDYFLLFQASGVWALAYMLRIIDEIYLEVNCEPPWFLYAVLFFPSFHFFTSSIGKDGPLALAVALAVWSSFDIRRRIVPLVVAVVLMVLFRPHIALVATMTLAACAFFDARVKTYVRVGLLIAAFGGLLVIATTLRSTFDVDVTSAESVGNFFDRQSEAAQQFDEGTAVLDASYPVRILSFMFRPFFFDSDTLLSFVASLENLFMVFFVLVMLARWRTAVTLSKRVFFARFALIFSVLLILLLSYVYYNVGLGLRQRTMLIPALFAFVAALVAVRKAERMAAPMAVPATG